MKKGCFFLASAILALFLLCGFDSQEKKVYDDGGLLTDEEEAELQTLLVEAAQRTEQDLIVVTTQDNQGKEAGDYADDFYDDHEFGYEKKNGSGVLLLIDMNSRSFRISTAGTAIEQYTDAEISDSLDAILPYMRSGDYAGACRTFVSEAERCLTGGETAGNGNYDKKTNRFAGHSDREDGQEKSLILKRLLIIFSGSAAVSAFVVLIISRKRKTRMSVNGATYLKNGRLELRERSDRFTHTTLVTRKIPEDNGGGGGHGGGHSSSHVSSGGHSHGGGGRSF